MIDTIGTISSASAAPATSAAPTQTGSSFSSYMMVSAAVQTLMGFERREGQERAADANERFQLEMQKLKEDHQVELENLKIQAMRNKMKIDRQYRLEEKFESAKLNQLTKELKALLGEKEFPLKKDSFPMIDYYIKEYRKLEYGPQVPLNAILLHTLGNIGVDYSEIVDSLDAYGEKMGNIEFRRWCDKDVSRNAALFNLNAILWNIPTVVISPYFWKEKVHFVVAMWDAQCETKPLIRPLFSIDVKFNELLNEAGRKKFQERITFISTMISGCARDSYALLAHGLPPTFPKLLLEDQNLREQLVHEDNNQILQFVINEYTSTRNNLVDNANTSITLSKEENMLLLSAAEDAIAKMQELNMPNKE